MRKPVLLSMVMAVALLVACGAAALAQPPEGPERYIVVLDNGVSDPGQAANAMAGRHGLGVGFVYSHALEGFSAVIPNEHVAAVRADERVAYIERDQTMYAEAQTLPWGIDKVDADTSSTKAGDGSGAVSNVNAYIIDSGIYRHTDLNVVKNVNFTGDAKYTDCHGHGTHVAGTVAAKDNAQDVVGVAPGAPLTGVKVLGCNGTGALSGVIKGVDWVTANAKKPAIANMSLGSGASPSQTLDDAVRKSANSGVFYSVVAGNKGENACLHSPARAGAGTNNGIMTVAATDELDQETSWSNYGRCVDIWAPGARILSTKMGGGTTTRGGTSMAAPHAGGGGALYLSKNTGASAASVEAALKGAATNPGTSSKDGRAIVLEYVGGF
jgi:subtilisin family serine protease